MPVGSGGIDASNTHGRTLTHDAHTRRDDTSLHDTRHTTRRHVTHDAHTRHVTHDTRQTTRRHDATRTHDTRMAMATATGYGHGHGRADGDIFDRPRSGRASPRWRRPTATFFFVRRSRSGPQSGLSLPKPAVCRAEVQPAPWRSGRTGHLVPTRWPSHRSRHGCIRRHRSLLGWIRVAQGSLSRGRSGVAVQGASERRPERQSVVQGASSRERRPGSVVLGASERRPERQSVVLGASERRPGSVRASSRVHPCRDRCRRIGG
jgi:hypothetical protein